MFRMLWCIDSMRKSVPVDSRDVLELEIGVRTLRAVSVEDDDDDVCKVGIRHSGLIMMPTMASKNTGLSTPLKDWLVLPLRTSRSPVHHLFKIFIRLSRSSGRRNWMDW